ncbi:hypothetical protein BST81_25250 [Leptolyngbya sp. 'hensonii']|uniref:nucleoid-associated protein n=1 Tax=Leptolyngbya sp. 'hensonii' TaxID=1922337 RepID=UPI00094F6E32|nr:nucleoid-associated protein [Leptolyngbya sp. 'hensonii']OLP15662.1 hypothetical protein BST81_25250 [Leptolyngbya sp. 'hensonii']
MRNSTGIQIDQLIVHIVNPRQPNGFVLSERCIPLDQGGDLTIRLNEYFNRHIENSLNDSATTAARFKTLTDGGVVPSTCQAVLHDGLDLVTGSKKLAIKLKEILDKDRRIASGNLAMCTYQAENYPSQRFIALMKIDPSDVFRQKIEIDEKNQQYVSFEIENDVMPTTQEKLQKCAFIQSLKPRCEDYDMMLLDRQIQKKQAAQFFTRDFLEVELTLDDKERTKRLYRGGIAAMNDLRSQLSPEENQAVSLAFDSAIRQDKVNIDQLIEALPLAKEHKEVIEKKLEEFKLPDREFRVHPTFAMSISA